MQMHTEVCQSLCYLVQTSQQLHGAPDARPRASSTQEVPECMPAGVSAQRVQASEWREGPRLHLPPSSPHHIWAPHTL